MHTGTIDSSAFFLLSVFDDFLNTILSLYNKLMPNERSLNQTTINNKTEVTEKNAKTRFDRLRSENAANERLKMADSFVCKPNNTEHNTQLLRFGSLDFTASQRQASLLST